MTTSSNGRDVQSDPALDDTTGSEWSDEGGATGDGPATNTADDADSTDHGGPAATDGAPS